MNTVDSYTIQNMSQGPKGDYRVTLKNGPTKSYPNFVNAFQETLYALRVRGGSIFLKKPANGIAYPIERTVLMPNGNVDGGNLPISITSDGATLQRIEPLNSMLDTQENSGIKLFSGLRFDGGNPQDIGVGPQADIQPQEKGILVNGGSNITVENCTFDNFGDFHPIACGGAINVLLQKNMVGVNGGFGAEGNCTNLRIINNTFYAQAKDFPILIAGNEKANTNVSVVSNRILAGTSNGGGIDCVAIGAYIANNYILNPYKHGIWVHDNIRYNGKDRPSNITITGNTIIGTGSAEPGQGVGIEQSSNVSISNNILDKGILLQNCGTITITGNTLGDRILQQNVTGLQIRSDNKLQRIGIGSLTPPTPLERIGAS